MISANPSTRNTKQLNDVFVIGAGASVPYGFPTGAMLLQELRQKEISPFNGEDLKFLVSSGYRDALHKSEPDFDSHVYWESSPHGKLCATWKRLVRGSVILTVDQFLKNIKDDEVRELGKRLMARQILMAERASCELPSKENLEKGHPSMHAVDWIQELFTRIDLVDNWRDYLVSTAFLTFNYDRVLEFFLERFLVVDKNWAIEDARQFISEEMSILHLNGYIGPLSQVPFGCIKNGNSSDFDPLFENLGEQFDPDWEAISARMRTVWEDVGNHHATQERARAATATAKRLFVIGTSFIPENFESIGLSSSVGSNPISWSGIDLSCTVQKLSPAQVKRAVNLLGIPINLINDYFLQKTAKDLVVDHVVL